MKALSIPTKNANNSVERLGLLNQSGVRPISGINLASNLPAQRVISPGLPLSLDIKTVDRGRSFTCA